MAKNEHRPPLKRGAKSLYTPERVETFLAGIAACLPMKQVCEMAGVTQETLYRWLREKPEFREKIDEARKLSEPALAQKVASDPSWKSSAWMLARINPERWVLRQDPQVAITIESILAVVRQRRGAGGLGSPALALDGQHGGLLPGCSGHQDEGRSIDPVQLESSPAVSPQQIGKSEDEDGEGASGGAEGPATGNIDVRPGEVLLENLIKRRDQIVHPDAPSGGERQPL